MEKKFLLLVTAIAIAKPGLAAADEKFSADSPVEKRNQDKTAIPKVEINGAVDYDPRRDDTASRTVIKQDEILKYGDVNIYDVLKRAPGVTVNEKSIRLRGLGNGYTQILVNGERPPAGFSLDIVTPEQIERIEIIRAAAAEFSMQSIAGTINIVLKKVVAKAQRDLRFNVRHSADSDGLLAIGTVADKKDNLSYYLTATATRNSSRPTAYSSQRSNAADETLLKYRDAYTHGGRTDTSLSLQPRLTWKLANDAQLSWNTSLQSSRSDGSYLIDISNLIGSFGLPEYANFQNGNTSRSDDLATDLSLGVKLGGGKLDAKLSVWRSKVKSDVHVISTTADQLVSSDRDAASDTTFLTRSSTGKYTRALFDGHTLAAGWEVNLQTADEERLRVEGLIGATPTRTADRFKPEVRRMAVYLQDEWSITKQWSLYQGIRNETIRTDSVGSNIPTTQSRSHVLSPVAQTLYKFPDKSGRQLRLAVTRTYKAPSTNQLTARRIEAEVNTRFSPDSSGNPDLRPELASGVDLTYEHFWAPGAVFSAGTSVRHITDYIHTILSQDNDGRWNYRPVNDGKASVHTVDLEIKLPLKAIWAAASAFELRASASRNWSKVSTVPGPDNRLDQQVPFSSNLGVDYKGGDKYSAGASFAFRAGGPVRISEQQSTDLQRKRDLEGYFLYKIQPGLQLRASISNVLGEESHEVYRYRGQDGTDETLTRRPNSRRIQLNLEIKL